MHNIINADIAMLRKSVSEPKEVFSNRPIATRNNFIGNKYLLEPIYTLTRTDKNSVQTSSFRKLNQILFHSISIITIYNLTIFRHF
jgi:hypothetical protein